MHGPFGHCDAEGLSPKGCFKFLYNVGVCLDIWETSRPHLKRCLIIFFLKKTKVYTNEVKKAKEGRAKLRTNAKNERTSKYLEKAKVK